MPHTLPSRCQPAQFVATARRPPFPETAMADQTLDTKGLACPLPILKVKKMLSGMPKGATLEVFATDPGSVPDFNAFSEATGHPLLEQSESNGVYRFVFQHSA
jgi:tRNA 2-thiouridine synthesizing protein A